MLVVYLKYNDLHEADSALQRAHHLNQFELPDHIWEINKNGVPNEVRAFFNNAGKGHLNPFDFPYPSDVETLARQLQPSAMYCEGVQIWPR